MTVYVDNSTFLPDLMEATTGAGAEPASMLARTEYQFTLRVMKPDVCFSREQMLQMCSNTWTGKRLSEHISHSLSPVRFNRPNAPVTSA